MIPKVWIVFISTQFDFELDKLSNGLSNILLELDM